MGRSLTPISFWNYDLKVKQVHSATRKEWFGLRSLKRFMNQPCALYKYDTGEYLLRFTGGEFIEFDGK